MNFGKKQHLSCKFSKNYDFSVAPGAKKDECSKREKLRYFCLDFPQFLLFTYSANPFRAIR